MRFDMPGSRARISGRLATKKMARGLLGSASVRAPIPFTQDGYSTPIYLNGGPRAVYDSVKNRTWTCWGGWTGQCRVPRVAYYDHNKEAWSPTYRAGTEDLTNDAHGNPNMTIDGNGNVHLFFGAHFNPGSVKHVSTLVAGDPSAWVSHPCPGPYTDTQGNHITEYPDAYVVGSNMFMLTRWAGSTDFDIGYIGPAAIASNGSVTNGSTGWGNTKQIIIGTPTSGTLVQNGRIYWSSGIVRNSTEIHFIGNRTDTPPPDVKMSQHIYYYRLDTSNGNIKSFDGTTTVVPGSQPIQAGTGAGTSDGSFRIFQSHDPPTLSQIPQMNYDTNGGCHVIYGDAVNYFANQSYPLPTYFDINVISNFGSGWSNPVTIGKSCNFGDTSPEIVPGPNGTMYALFTDVTSNFPAAGFASVYVAVRGAGANGKWGSKRLLMPAPQSPYRAIEAVRVRAPAHPNFRALIWTAGPNDSDNQVQNGTNKLWAWGDRGFIRKAPSYHAPQSFVGWSPCYTMPGLALSNSTTAPLTIKRTAASGFTNQLSAMTAGITLGQSCYWEISADTEAGAGNNGVGLTSNAQSFSTGSWYGGGTFLGDNYSFITYSDGFTQCLGAAISGSPFTGWTSSGNISFAMNWSGGIATIWWRINGGAWKPSGTPGVSGGYSLPGGIREFLPAVNLSDLNSQYTLKILPSSWTYAAPSGFMQIGGSI